ncbi:leucyl aminopeptidase [Pseudoruegeria sp. SHC-113]|uniref:leucyl aminopeptidase n=1 Tax=Pseudoruegeria sp. SHC-113 TaxID=2855439 RepID=UPI0021BB6B32|nr:leucyl aminopeptidase [Pseudoruegeria sp. SHC-113]MCT8160604.1 leucyl aminopeptidase [Pseudoruegeria sp. SHC-113]
MTPTAAIEFKEIELDAIAAHEGSVAVFLGSEGAMDQCARRVNRVTKGALARMAESESFEKMKEGEATVLAFPQGLAAEKLVVVKLDRRAKADVARKAGAAIGKTHGKAALLVLAGNLVQAAELSFGLAMRAYDFSDHKSKAADPLGAVHFMVAKPEEIAAQAAPMAAVAEGVFFTRDLVNEPANVLTTTDFAARLAAMQELGLEVEILEEDELEKLGFRTLLSVGQGSESPSKVVVMQWNGGGDEKPFAFVGKGVVFDTGGISIKPAAGMEDMTMDMGGAGTVAGVMRTLALRKAKANVVGIVGLVENMPDGKATRPGDVVKSMKGDTIEIINTDAEGRLVLADCLWYAQERFEPTGMINLATLTGAIIIGLGHENTGAFSNDDALCNAFLKAAAQEGEGAWRLPMGQAYDDQLKSRIADMKNVGTRAGGSITAAQFLQRFVKEGTPWIHLDIAGTASVKSETTLAPAGATGWGVMALDRLIRNGYEAG